MGDRQELLKAFVGRDAQHNAANVLAGGGVRVAHGAELNVTGYFLVDPRDGLFVRPGLDDFGEDENLVDRERFGDGVCGHSCSLPRYGPMCQIIMTIHFYN